MNVQLLLEPAAWSWFRWIVLYTALKAIGAIIYVAVQAARNLDLILSGTSQIDRLTDLPRINAERRQAMPADG